MGKKNRNKGGGRRDRYDDIYGDYGRADYDDYQDESRDEDYQFSYRNEVDNVEFVDVDENTDDGWDETEEASEPESVSSEKRRETAVDSKISSVKAASSDSSKTRSTVSEEREAWAMIHEKNVEQEKSDAKTEGNADGEKKFVVKKCFTALTGALKLARRAAELFKRKSKNTSDGIEISNGREEISSGEIAERENPTANKSAEIVEKKEETSKAEDETVTAEVTESKGKGFAQKILAIGGKFVEKSKLRLFRKKKAKEEGEPTAETEVKAEETVKKTKKAETSEHSIPGVPDKTFEDERREKRKTYLILGASTVAVALLFLIAGVIYLASGIGGSKEKIAKKMDDPSSESSLKEDEDGKVELESSDASIDDFELPRAGERQTASKSNGKKLSADLKAAENANAPDSTDVSDDASGLDVLDSSDLSGTDESEESESFSAMENLQENASEPLSSENESDRKSGLNTESEMSSEILGTSDESLNPSDSEKKKSVQDDDSSTAPTADSEFSSVDSNDITVGEALDGIPETSLDSNAGNERALSGDDVEKKSEDPFAASSGAKGNFAQDETSDVQVDGKVSGSEDSGKTMDVSELPGDENSVSIGPTLATDGGRRTVPDSLLTPDGVSSGSNVSEWDQSTDADPVLPSVSDMNSLALEKNENSNSASNNKSVEENDLPTSENSQESVSNDASELGIDLNNNFDESKSADPSSNLSDQAADASASDAGVQENQAVDSTFSAAEKSNQKETDSLMEPPALNDASVEGKKDSKNSLAELNELSSEISEDNLAADGGFLENSASSVSRKENGSSELEADSLAGLGRPDASSDDSEVSGKISGDFQTSSDSPASDLAQPSSLSPSSVPEKENDADDFGLGELGDLDEMTNLSGEQNAQNSQFKLNSEINGKKSDGVNEHNGAKSNECVDYAVHAGDTYWKISDKFYGTPAYKEALARYNSDVVPDSNDLKAGISLQIPDLEFLRSCFPTLCPQSSQVVYVPSTVSGESRPIQFYVVEKGDTLSELAEKILGDASRWPDIYRLNREKIQDLNLLPVGEKLQIPVENTASPSRFWK